MPGHCLRFSRRLQRQAPIERAHALVEAVGRRLVQRDRRSAGARHPARKLRRRRIEGDCFREVGDLGLRAGDARGVLAEAEAGAGRILPSHGHSVGWCEKTRCHGAGASIFSWPATTVPQVAWGEGGGAMAERVSISSIWPRISAARTLEIGGRGTAIESPKTTRASEARATIESPLNAQRRNNGVDDARLPALSLEYIAGGPRVRLETTPIHNGSPDVQANDCTIVTVGLAGAAWAQDADHPKDKPLVVGSDFGVAPWMVRGAAARRASAST